MERHAGAMEYGREELHGPWAIDGARTCRTSTSSRAVVGLDDGAEVILRQRLGDLLRVPSCENSQTHMR